MQENGPVFWARRDGTTVHLELGPAPDDMASIWQKLAEAIAMEPGLLCVEAAVLKVQFETGRAALALYGNQPIAYISVVPLLDQETRRHFEERVGILPDVEISMCSTGWTAKAWRKASISHRLRAVLYARHRGLLMSRPLGIGAAPVLHRLGFKLMRPSEVPFLNSLFGWPLSGGNYMVRSGEVAYAHLQPYEGPSISPFETSVEYWAPYITLWVSDAPLAQAFEAQLCSHVGDLEGWRHHIRQILSPKSA